MEKTGPVEIEAGSTAAYQLALQNVGSVAATALGVADTLSGGGALPVTGAPAALDAGATASASASYAVPANTTVQTLDDRGTVSWSDAAGNHYGPLGDDFSSKVIAKRKLSVIKTAEVIGDPGGDQQIRYEISVTDLGDQPVSNVVLTDTIDPYTDLLPDTVTATQGSIAVGSATGDPTLTVSLGTLAGRSTAVVGFRVHVRAPLPDGVTAISNQAIVTSTELPAILSDDPDQPGATDPTTVPAFPGGAGGSGGGDGGGSLPRPSLGEPTPADGLTVTEPLTISREISPPDGQTITSWKIAYRRVGMTTDVTLATGTGAPPAAAAFQSLAAMSVPGDSVTAQASFDPTTVPNGTYLITVSAQASGGGIQTGSTSLIVDGDLKPGRYVTSYQDLNVGVGGMPMQAVRTYDSFDKASGDFGVGWHLDIANFRVNVNKPFGLGGWQQQTAGCGLIFCATHYTSSTPHFATVVWPDGHQEIFDFAPRDGSTFFSLLTAAAFKGRPGSTSTLAVEGDDSLAWLGDGNLYGGFFGSGPVFDAQRFRLTAKDGTVYILDRSSGLVSATDRNGNSLTVSPAGVVSSLGPSITLTRDPQGRITKMVGPTNETLLYSYSPSGDLASFTDELNRVFRYEYDGDHNLLVSRDPANVPFRTLTYDPAGRLATLADGAGNTTHFQTDIGARQEVVTDPTGRLSTVTTHDARGNVIRTDQTFDGRTITTTSTYDGTDHLTSETDPLGHTSNLAWDGKGNLVTLADPEGRTWRLTYTANGFPETIVAPGGALALRLEYDTAGNLIKQDRAEGEPLTFGYTGGQLTSVTDGQGHSTTLQLNAEGRIEKITGPDLQARTFTYDASGRTLSVTEPDTGVTRFTYDAVGNMLTATDARNQVRRYTYDPRITC